MLEDAQSGFLSPPLLSNRPSLIRIIQRHACCQLLRIFSKVFLVNYTVMVHDKGHDPGIVIFGRIGKDGKASDHLALDDVVIGTPWSVLPLGGKNPEEITMIGFIFVLLPLRFITG
jgi:hypothetical protein